MSRQKMSDIKVIIPLVGSYSSISVDCVLLQTYLSTPAAYLIPNPSPNPNSTTHLIGILLWRYGSMWLLVEVPTYM